MAYETIKMGNTYTPGTYYREYIIESESDLSDMDETESCSTGSVAYTVDLKIIAIKAISGDWVFVRKAV